MRSEIRTVRYHIQKTSESEYTWRDIKEYVWLICTKLIYIIFADTLDVSMQRTIYKKITDHRFYYARGKWFLIWAP